MKKLLTVLLCIILMLFTSGCSFVNGLFGKNSNLEEEDDPYYFSYDDITYSAYDDMTTYEEAVLDVALFDMNIESVEALAMVEISKEDCTTYFDKDKIYKTFKLNLDVNKLLAKYSVGTGVIAVVAIMYVVTAGAETTFACIIAGAATGAITGATSGVIFGGALGAVASYIQSGGDWEETATGAIEGAVDGYMWGAVFGAISGAATSEYCFTGDTLVETERGKVPIASITTGDNVLSWNIQSQQLEYQKVTHIFENRSTKITTVSIGGDSIASTPDHPYLTLAGWVGASDLKAGDLVYVKDGLQCISSVSTTDLFEPISVYNIEVFDNHNYIVGEVGAVVHNKCIINKEYAGQTRHFDPSDDLFKKQAAKYPEMYDKYPNGIDVYFNLDGYADFSPFIYKGPGVKTNIFKADEVSKEALAKGSCLTGTAKDMNMADAAAGINKAFRQKNKLVWHHLEDKQTMILISQDVHGLVRHSGGAELIRAMISAMQSAM